jgi:uncharacterized membrane protein
MSDMFLFAGSYDSLEDAQADFDGLAILHAEKFFGRYQAAIFTKDEEGKVKVLDTTSTTRTTGAKWGAGIGAVLGVVFPPSILVSTAVGAGAGAAIGNLAKGWMSWDIKDIAETAENGTSGVLVIAEATPERGAEHLLKHAKKLAKREIDVQAEEAKAALDEIELT